MNKYEIKDIPIKGISFYNKRKDGTPLLTKNEDPYVKVLLEIDSNAIDDMEFDGKMSMLDFNNVSSNWDKGTLITGTIERNGDYWNFELPKEPSLRDTVRDHEERIKKLEDVIFEINSEKEDEDLGEEDLPF